MNKLCFVFLFGLASWAANVNYSYDPAGRLAKIDYGSGGSITYTYDNAGNLLSRTVVAAQPSAPQQVKAPPTGQARQAPRPAPGAAAKPTETKSSQRTGSAAKP